MEQRASLCESEHGEVEATPERNLGLVDWVFYCVPLGCYWLILAIFISAGVKGSASGGFSKKTA